MSLKIYLCMEGVEKATLTCFSGTTCYFRYMVLCSQDHRSKAGGDQKNTQKIQLSLSKITADVFPMEPVLSLKLNHVLMHLNESLVRLTEQKMWFILLHCKPIFWSQDKMGETEEHHGLHLYVRWVRRLFNTQNLLLRKIQKHTETKPGPSQLVTHQLVNLIIISS